ncbi:MAG: recombinase family protein, partial [Pseudomonadales bacterium]
ATGKLILTTLGAIATFERELMLERQAEGIARAKAEGKYRGRKPTAMEKRPEVQQLTEQGFNPSQISKKLGVSRSSVYRALA